MKTNIVLIGIMGCGKTTLARKLQQRLAYQFIDLDEYVESKYQETISSMFLQGEEHFRDRETVCCKEVSKQEACIISTGGGVIKRKENMEALKEHGYVIYVDRPIEHILQDVDTSKRPLLKDGPQALYDLYEQRHALYQEYSDYHFINDQSLEDSVDKLMMHIISNIKIPEV